MIKTNLWRPDTCECEMEYEWDDAVDQNSRVHTISEVKKSCPAHAGLVGKVKIYNVVMDENKRKNIIFGKILENIPTAVEEIIQDDGSIVKQLKKGKNYNWSFDANRILQVDLVGFTDAEKNAVKTLANSFFPNKVTIV